MQYKQQPGGLPGRHQPLQHWAPPLGSAAGGRAQHESQRMLSEAHTKAVHLSARKPTLLQAVQGAVGRAANLAGSSARSRRAKARSSPPLSPALLEPAVRFSALAASCVKSVLMSMLQTAHTWRNTSMTGLTHAACRPSCGSWSMRAAKQSAKSAAKRVSGSLTSGVSRSRWLRPSPSLKQCSSGQHASSFIHAKKYAIEPSRRRHYHLKALI